MSTHWENKMNPPHTTVKRTRRSYNKLEGELLEVARRMVEDRCPHSEIARTLNVRLSDIPAPALTREECGYYVKHIGNFNKDGKQWRL